MPALPLLGMLASCTSLAIEDVVPQTPLAAQPAMAAPARPTQPDGYPNLNVPLEPASPQLAESEKQQLTQELTAARQRQATGPDASQALSEEERLRLLARSHAERALGEIEASE